MIINNYISGEKLGGYETINDIFHTFGTINDVVQKELNNK